MSDIEVVTVRDPDSGTEVRVFVNGVDVTDEASVFHVDPGAGYTLSDWRETTEHDVKAASRAAGEFIREQRDGCEDSHYLLADDEPESAPAACRYCGTAIHREPGGAWVDATDGDGCDPDVHEPEPTPSTVRSKRVGSEYDVERRGGLVAVTDDYGRLFVADTLEEAVTAADDENVKPWRCVHCRTEYENSDDPIALTPCPDNLPRSCWPVA